MSRCFLVQLRAPSQAITCFAWIICVCATPSLITSVLIVTGYDVESSIRRRLICKSTGRVLHENSTLPCFSRFLASKCSIRPIEPREPSILTVDLIYNTLIKCHFSWFPQFWNSVGNGHRALNATLSIGLPKRNFLNAMGLIADRVTNSECIEYLEGNTFQTICFARANGSGVLVYNTNS